MRFKRYLPLLLILIGMAAIYFSGLYRFFTFETLRSYHDTLKLFIQAHPIAAPLLYILAYILLTALSVPGAVFLSLLGGYLFPQPFSTIYVLFSATCGASLIFLAARTALGDSLKAKAGPFLQKMEKGFKENAVSYLLFFALRSPLPLLDRQPRSRLLRRPLKHIRLDHFGRDRPPAPLFLPWPAGDLKKSSQAGRLFSERDL